MTMQRRFERRHMICFMPYTMACGLFIYFAILQTSVRTARNDKKRVGQNKNIYQVLGTYIVYSTWYYNLVQASYLFSSQPVICVCSSREFVYQTKSNSGRIEARRGLTPHRRGTQERHETSKGRRSPYKVELARRVMKELLHCSYISSLARFEPV